MASAANHSLNLENLSLSERSEYSKLDLYPQFNILDTYRFAIVNEVHRIVGADKLVIRNALAWATNLDHGDFVLAIPALRLKDKKPDQIAANVAANFHCPLLEPPTAAGSFVRFCCETKTLATTLLPTILQRKFTFGFNRLLGRQDQDPNGRQKKIIVEYSAPNIAKEFHTGHLRSTIIGNFLTKLYKTAGWDVVSMNYIGDWGKQYGVLCEGFDKYGSEDSLLDDPIKHLNHVYVKINKDSAAEQQPVKLLKEKIESLKKLKAPPKQKKTKGQLDPEPTPHTWTDEQENELQQTIKELVATQKQLEDLPSIDEKARRFFKRMTERDPDAIRNWQRFRDLSIDRYEKMYKRLNITFDDYSGESTVKEEHMQQCAEIMAQKGITEESDGAIMVDFTKHGAKRLGQALVRKRDGTALYLTRDIAANYERYQKYNFDKMIYVVANQQDVHLAQLFKILELMGPPYSDVVAKCQHVAFGLVKAANGETMSTRKGTVVSLEDALNDVTEYMHDVMKKNAAKYDKVPNKEWTADVLGTSSLIVYDFTGKLINGYNFDKAAMTSEIGDTGPYLQYAHARMCSVKREAQAKFSSLSDEALLRADFSLVTQVKEGATLVRLLSQWPDVVLNTFKTHEPVTILGYLFKLTHRFSTTYEVKDPNTGAKSMSVKYAESDEKRVAVMALYDCARQVLRNGMEVLGLTPVESM